MEFFDRLGGIELGRRAHRTKLEHVGFGGAMPIGLTETEQQIAGARRNGLANREVSRPHS